MYIYIYCILNNTVCICIYGVVDIFGFKYDLKVFYENSYGIECD